MRRTRLSISGIAVEVTWKDIKNIHLSVMPPDGKVRVSAPRNLSKETIQVFLRTKVSWIRQQREKFARQSRLSEREFVSGESLFVFGKQYYLQVKYARKNSLVLNGKNAILTVRKESSSLQRENFVRGVLRKKLKTEIAKRLPKWEKRMHLACGSWGIRRMEQRWGSCGLRGNLRFNLLLVHVPLKCLDYIIVHELAHLKVRHHTKEFDACVAEQLPYWQDIRKDLIDFVLMPMKPEKGAVSAESVHENLTK